MKLTEVSRKKDSLLQWLLGYLHDLQLYASPQMLCFSFVMFFEKFSLDLGEEGGVGSYSCNQLDGFLTTNLHKNLEHLPFWLINQPP